MPPVGQCSITQSIKQTIAYARGTSHWCILHLLANELWQMPDKLCSFIREYMMFLYTKSLFYPYLITQHVLECLFARYFPYSYALVIWSVMMLTVSCWRVAALQRTIRGRPGLFLIKPFCAAESVRKVYPSHRPFRNGDTANCALKPHKCAHVRLTVTDNCTTFHRQPMNVEKPVV